MNNLLLYFRGRVALAELLIASGIGEGDKVAIQAYTCSAVPEGVYASKAKPLYIDAQKRIAETGWHVYIAYVTVYAGMNKDVQNFKLYPDLMERLAWVWLDQ